MTTLTPLQLKALAVAKHRAGFCYFLEMGLGKSLLALAEFTNLVNEDKRATRMVVFSPNSFKQGWRAEIEKHGMDFDVHVYSASKHKKGEAFVTRGTHTPANGGFTKPAIMIVNYDALRLPKVATLVDTFTRGRKCMLVCDESINLKNPTAKRTRAVHRMVRGFSYVRLLSGKPQTQGAHDLWGQLTTIGALNGERFFNFRGRYCRMGGFENRQVIGIQNAAELQARLAPHCIIAKKADWLASLPAKSYTIRDYELKGVMLAEYQRMEDDFVAFLRKPSGEVSQAVRVEIALSKYQKLSQIHTGFLFDEDGKAHQMVPDKDNSRLQELLEILDTEVVGKAAICFKHRPVGNHLMHALRDYQPAMLIGGQSPERIEAEKTRFNTVPECRVILLQLD
ncbi:MAG: SNF2-related protein, partial [Vicinamibacterales bacterium]